MYQFLISTTENRFSTTSRRALSSFAVNGSRNETRLRRPAFGRQSSWRMRLPGNYALFYILLAGTFLVLYCTNFHFQGSEASMQEPVRSLKDETDVELSSNQYTKEEDELMIDNFLFHHGTPVWEEFTMEAKWVALCRVWEAISGFFIALYNNDFIIKKPYDDIFIPRSSSLSKRVRRLLAKDRQRSRNAFTGGSYLRTR